MRLVRATVALVGVALLFCIGAPIALLAWILEAVARGLRWVSELIGVAMLGTFSYVVGEDKGGKNGVRRQGKGQDNGL